MILGAAKMPLTGRHGCAPHGLIRNEKDVCNDKI